jgi:predicted dehydrogenase
LPTTKKLSVCEEHAATREELKGQYTFTHTSYQALLDEVDVDIIAVVDYYTIRGQRVIQALEHGKRIIADKPLCTSLAELDTIEALSSEKGIVGLLPVRHARFGRIEAL